MKKIIGIGLGMMFIIFYASKAFAFTGISASDILQSTIEISASKGASTIDQSRVSSSIQRNYSSEALGKTTTGLSRDQVVAKDLERTINDSILLALAVMTGRPYEDLESLSDEEIKALPEFAALTGQMVIDKMKEKNPAALWQVKVDMATLASALGVRELAAQWQQEDFIAQAIDSAL